MSADSSVRLIHHGEVEELVISRPERSNALRVVDKHSLASAIRSANERGARALLITQGESRSFCAGTDITEMKDLTPEQGMAMLQTEAELFEAVMTSAAPVVAAVNGAALGAGCVLVCCCDLVVAGSHAFFGQPEVRNGIPAPVHAALLPQIVGLGVARRMLYRLDQLTANEALQLGLVHEVVPDGDVRSRALEAATALTKLPRQGLMTQKEIVNTWVRHGFAASIRSSIYMAGAAFGPEAQTAIERFLELRKKETS